MIIKLSLEELEDHIESNDGICLGCGEWSCGGVEPDARGYECEVCGENKVMGAEEALIAGELVVD